MPLSYNGHIASSDPDAIGVRNYTLPGTDVDFPAGIAYWAAPLLLWAAGEWDRRIERVVPGTCWGYFYRLTTGGSSLSNHASGTAIDINAPQHPYSVAGTFNDRQRQELANILTEANRHATVLVSGEFYRSSPDGMHLEVADGASKQDVINAGFRLTQDKDWFDMATKAELRDVVDNALDAKLTADNPALLNAVRVAIEAERAEEAAAVWDHKLLNAVTGEEQKAGTFLRYVPKRFAEILAAVKS